MASYNLLVTPIAGTSGQLPTNQRNLVYAENLLSGTVLGKITAAPGAPLNAWNIDKADGRLTMTAPVINEDTGVTGDNLGRFQIVKALTAGPNGAWAVNDWLVVLAQASTPAGESLFNFEDQSSFNNGAIRFNATMMENGSEVPNANKYSIDFRSSLRDVNEAPTLTGDNAFVHVADGVQGATVGALGALDEDDAANNSSATYTYAIDRRCHEPVRDRERRGWLHLEVEEYVVPLVSECTGDRRPEWLSLLYGNTAGD
jgi:hypothetical protein